jgi:hypothetical protein
MRPTLLLILCLALPGFAADASWSAPLLTAGNRWLMSDAEGHVDYEVSITKLSDVSGAKVATLTVKVLSGQNASPLNACVMQNKKGLFVTPTNCAETKAIKTALKGKPQFSEPPVAYERRLNAASEDMPETEALVLASQTVLGAQVQTAHYTYSADMGFEVELAPGVGFTKLIWNLQEGGGSLTLTRFIAVDPFATTTFEALNLDASGRKAMSDASVTFSATGEFGAKDQKLTALVRGDAASTELAVVDAAGKTLFVQKFPKHGPRGVRYEEATGELSVFFDANDKLEDTAKTLSWNEKKKRFELTKRVVEPE